MKTLKWFEPEIFQLLGQLVFAVDRSNEFRLHQLIHDFLLILERQQTHPLGLLRQILQVLLVLICFHPQAFGRDIDWRILVNEARGGKGERGVFGRGARTIVGSPAFSG